uniref:Reverse transcriptase domain-containing protein n=1 Tax=Tanacetum cinerariifolium TaxID=118510 RepID=A0A699J988_TANCI|nr:hypothetical protein [Tanacetum cinerariifolium]
MAANSGINGTHTEILIKEVEKETEAENGTKNKPNKRAKREEQQRHPALSPLGGLKCMNALVDQGSDVNGMPLSTYMKLTDKRPDETDIRLSLASHSYIYRLGIAEDVLVDIVGYVYLVDDVILNIKEDE